MGDRIDSFWESLIYKECEDRGYFEVDGNLKLRKGQVKPKTYCIMMPPPNVTGVLHIGHALTFTLQDIIVRYKRMDGFEVLWQPGLDHAGIATQHLVEKQLLAKGLSKEELGREEFIKKVWEWKEQSGGGILKQLRIMGFSPAFKRTRFTLDEGLANAVRATFVKWYQSGLIYRGKRMINWCVKDGALSDIEVEHKENNGRLYHLRYYLANSKDFIVVATTRPETYFGDSAVMAHPEDERYKHLVGQKLVLPLVGREIPIVFDSIVDTSFGSGAVKVTPAHDINDYEVGLRHGLDQIVIFDEKGILNENCGEFRGLDRLDAREAIVKRLEKEGFIEKIEDYQNSIGTCYRCGSVIEPYVSKQWFVKADIARRAMQNIEAGETRFYPPQWKNNYKAWMRELKDWCISRQLWWGHRIPVFYCTCGEEFALQNWDEKRGAKCPSCGKEGARQDENVLDTWFSSALWSHSTLGYENGDYGRGVLWQEGDLEKFHPNSLLITGFDILFFWVARMLWAADSNVGQPAFKHVYLHALVLDEEGRKMSKSRGNVVDPLELCRQYSPDIVRFSLAYLCIQGRDLWLSTKQLEVTRNFTNKIINALKFLQLYAGQLDSTKQFEERAGIASYQSPLGIYLKSRLNLAIAQSREALDSYRFDVYASTVYRFLWSEFCDLGIEYAKADKPSVFELGSVLLESMKLLHPLMPFISEFVFHSLLGRNVSKGLGGHDSIMIEAFPTDIERRVPYEEGFEIISDCITTLRRLRVNLDIGNEELETVFIQTYRDSYDMKEIGEDDRDIRVRFQELGLRFITKLARVKRLFLVDSKPEGCIADIGKHAQVFIEAKNLDLSGVIARLDQQEAKLEKEVAKLKGLLENEKFLKKAPKEVVESNKATLEELDQRRQKIMSEKEALRGI